MGRISGLAGVAAGFKSSTSTEPLWSLVMQFDQPDQTAANKTGVVIIDGGYGVTLSPVAGRFADAAAVPPLLTIDWSVADAYPGGAYIPWTWEAWIKSPTGGHLKGFSLASPGLGSISGAMTPADATWRHYAVVSDGVETRGYAGGVLEVTTGPGVVPPFATLNYYTPADAQIDAMRMTVGLARYTGASFTPPSSPPTP